MYPIYPLCNRLSQKILCFLNQFVLEKSEFKVGSHNFPPPSISKLFYCLCHSLNMTPAGSLATAIATVRIGHWNSSARAECTPGRNNMHAGHVTYWSSRYVGFETSFCCSCFTTVSITIIYIGIIAEFIVELFNFKRVWS